MRISSGVLGVMLTGFLAISTSPALFADDVLYSNLGSGSTVYQGGAGWYVDTNYKPAFSFTASSTDYLTELDIALSSSSGTNAVTVELLNDSSGPGTVLESWAVGNLPLFNTTSTTLQTLTSTGGVELVSGDTYWIAMLPGGSDTYAVWNWNSTSATGTQYENEGSGWAEYATDVPTGAVEVLGTSETPTPTPEPGTFALLGSGLLGLAGALRRKYCR
jgi:hypothetical protein